MDLLDRIHGIDFCFMTQLRISEAAAYLGVSDDTLRRWIDAGRVRATSDASGRQVVEGSEVARLLRETAPAHITAETAPIVGRSARNRFADASQTDHTKFFTADTGAEGQAADFVFPMVCTYKPITPSDVAASCDQEAPSQIGDTIIEYIWRVAH